MRNDLAMYDVMQDSAKARVADSTSATTVQAAEPAYRTPENAGFMHIAYTVAAIIYGSYLLVLRRRWSALRKRQANNAAQSRR